MIDGWVRAIAVGMITMVAIFNVAAYYLPSSNVGPFSELGVLGPNQKIGEYPTTVLTGQNFTLYLYIGNHEGHVVYYEVLAKLGERSSVVNENVSLDAPPLAAYATILRDNQTYLGPITLLIPHNGTNLRVVFELWVFRTGSSTFVYDHRFTQLWLNVTGPPL